MDICLKGSREGEKLLFHVIKAGDYDIDEGYPLTCEIIVDTAWCHVEKMRHYTYLYHFQYFRDELLKCFNTLNGETEYANWSDGSSDCEIVVRMTSRGHAIVTGKLWKYDSSNDELKFSMETDQSCFPELISSVNALEQLLREER